MVKKIRKIKPFTKVWERMANELARDVVFIGPCRECGRPHLQGYCCIFCGSTDPRDDRYDYE